MHDELYAREYLYFPVGVLLCALGLATVTGCDGPQSIVIDASTDRPTVTDVRFDYDGPVMDVAIMDATLDEGIDQDSTVDMDAETDTGIGPSVDGAIDVVSDRGNLPEAGGACRSACDCPDPLGCFDGLCQAGIAPVYCCTSTECPGNESCQYPDGSYLTCNLRDAQDGGIMDYCQNHTCTNNQQCINRNCNYCDENGRCAR
jgi:hypothetical protein